MFKTEDKVPEYYVNQSRDFQLLCLLLDLVENHITCGTFASDMIDDVYKVKDSLLDYFGSKLGFITKYPLNMDYLREIYKFFSKSNKYKGTSSVLNDVQYLINQFSNITDCKITNASEDGDEYKVTYYADVLINENMLYSLMRYLLPAGYNLGTEILKRKEQGVQQDIDYNETWEWLKENAPKIGFDTARLSEIRLDSLEINVDLHFVYEGHVDIQTGEYSVDTTYDTCFASSELIPYNPSKTYYVSFKGIETTIEVEKEVNGETEIVDEIRPQLTILFCYASDGSYLGNIDISSIGAKGKCTNVEIIDPTVTFPTTTNIRLQGTLDNSDDSYITSQTNSWSCHYASSITKYVQNTLDDLCITDISDIEHRAINATDVGHVTNRVVEDIENFPDVVPNNVTHEEVVPTSEDATINNSEGENE